MIDVRAAIPDALVEVVVVVVGCGSIFIDASLFQVSSVMRLGTDCPGSSVRRLEEMVWCCSAVAVRDREPKTVPEACGDTLYTIIIQPSVVLLPDSGSMPTPSLTFDAATEWISVSEKKIRSRKEGAV